MLNEILDRIPSMRLASGFEYQRVKMFMMRGPSTRSTSSSTPELRNALEEIRETPDGPALRFVHVDEVPAQEVVAQLHGTRRVGVHLKFLEWTKDRMVAFTYYDPGLILERHTHGSDALIFIIEGDVTVGDHPCPAGTLIVLEKGAAFGPLVAGPKGCTFLECYGDDVRPVPVDKDTYFDLLAELGISPAAQPRVGGAARHAGRGAGRSRHLVLSVQRAATPRIVDRVSRRLLIATGLSLLVLVFAPLFLWLVEHGRSDDMPLRGRRLRMALPHVVREQHAVQAEEPIRLPVVLDRAGRGCQPRTRSPPRRSRHGSWPPSSDKEQGWGRSKARTTS